MKDATGDMTMTIVVIVLIVMVLGIGRWLFGEGGPLRERINREVTNSETLGYVEVIDNYYV